ncbi:hypothetical protein GGI43DRAFT_79357 [Trichoderma evansii]
MTLMSKWDLGYSQHIEQWDIEDERDEIRDVEFSADFELIRCQKYTICQIFRAETGVCLESVENEAFGIRNCPWAMLANNLVKIWQSDEENRHKTLKIPEELHQVVESRKSIPLFLSPDFALLAAMSGGSICIWKCDTGVLILKEINISASNLRFSPDSSLLLLEELSPESPHVTLWRISTGQSLINSMKARFIGFSPDSALALIRRQSCDRKDQFLLYLGEDILELLSTETGHVVYELGKLDYKRNCDSHCFSQNGSILALSGLTFIEIWNLETKSLIQLISTGCWTGLSSFSLGNTCLITDLGAIGLEADLSFNVDMAAATSDILFNAFSREHEKTSSRRGLNFGRDFRWIMWNEEKLLYIPAEYCEQGRQVLYASDPTQWSPRRLVLESPSDRLIIVGFSIEKVQALFSRI